MSRNLRHLVNFGLVFSFVTLGVTGVMGFVLPFDIATTRVHVVFGLLTCLLVGVHIVQRLDYFKAQTVGGAKRSVPTPVLVGMAMVCALLVFGGLRDWGFIRAVIGLGHETRHRAEIVRPSPLSASLADGGGVRVARQQRGTDNVALQVHVAMNDSVGPRPALAIWAESTTGSMIETLYLSGDVAYSDQPEWQGKVTPRKHILPVWRHRYTLVTGIDPDGKVDGVTGATEHHRFSLDAYLQSDAGEYIIFVEVNAAQDPDAQWLDAHVGQPSVLYSVFVEHGSHARYFLGELIGHGGAAETSGEISYDLDRLSSARSLVDLILVASRPIAESP